METQILHVRCKRRDGFWLVQFHPKDNDSQKNAIQGCAVSMLHMTLRVFVEVASAILSLSDLTVDYSGLQIGSCMILLWTCTGEVFALRSLLGRLKRLLTFVQANLGCYNWSKKTPSMIGCIFCVVQEYAAKACLLASTYYYCTTVLRLGIRSQVHVDEYMVKVPSNCTCSGRLWYINYKSNIR